MDKYFLCDNKSFNEKITEETIIEIKKIISELFIFRSNENHFIEDIVKWFRENKNKYGITIMEILIYLYLDNNIMNQNGNDILYNLFCFTSLNNKKNIVTISLVIELIYSLYKKYCIYFDELAEKILLELKDIFGDRLYMELMRHGIKEEIETETEAPSIAKSSGLH